MSDNYPYYRMETVVPQGTSHISLLGSSTITMEMPAVSLVELIR